MNPSSANFANSVVHSQFRTYAGLLGQPGCRVLSLNDRTKDVGLRTEQPSGAFVTVKADGSWIYEPPTAMTALAHDQKVVDRFRCDVKTDGAITQESVSMVLRNPNADGQALVESRRRENPLKTSATAPVRLLVRATTFAKLEIDLRVISGHEGAETPAMLVLEQPTGGTAVAAEDSGCVTFSPKAGFTGMTEIRCLVENRNRSATFVIIHVDVQPPVQTHTSAMKI